MAIHKVGDMWMVTDRSGKKRLGMHKSREEAMAQMRAIEAKKRRKRD